MRLQELAIRVVGIGDSTTAGTPGFRSPVEAPPHGSGDVRSQYAYWLRRMHSSWSVLNRGVNRERTSQVRARLHEDALRFRPDVLIVLAGVNDVYDGLPLSRPRREIRRICHESLAAGVPLVVLGTVLPYDSASARDNIRARELNDWIRHQARTHERLTFCDTRTAVAATDDPDRLAATPDGLHPDVDGYRRMAVALERVIAPRCPYLGANPATSTDRTLR